MSHGVSFKAATTLSVGGAAVPPEIADISVSSILLYYQFHIHLSGGISYEIKNDSCRD